MFFASLSLVEYLALFGIAGALLTILYLLDRTRRRQVVATLQFYSTAQRPTEARRKRRIREPLSLLLQLLALALLLAAVAELRFGSEDDTARDHVLILDASAWMAAGSGEEILMDEVRRLALGFVRALPDGDRVMVVRAGALVTPVTRFEADREKVEEAIQLSEPGSAALELGEALEFAARVQALDAKRPGEIVFAGAGRIHDADEAHRMSAPPNLRVMSVETPVRNIGLRRVGLRHSPDEADLWQVFASVRNDSEAPTPVEVAIQFSGAPVAGRELMLEPGEEREVMFPLRTPAAGLLE
ncbi:MAG: VWA domain-containing protein, partial [bacterium]|nr:VWA domain-containing protein [bacterium]